MKKILIILFIILLFTACEKTKRPEWSVEPGMYPNEIEVYVKNRNDNKAILYTLNGENPKKAKIFHPATMEYKGQRYKVKMGQTLTIKYNAFRPKYKETGVITLEYKVRPKLEMPEIKIDKNIITFNKKADYNVKYKINDEEYNIYKNPIVLKKSKYKITYYAEKVNFVNSDTKEVEVEINVEMVKTTPPEFSLEKNILKFKEYEGKIFYSIGNSSNFKEYKKNEEIVLKIGTQDIYFYSTKEGFFNSDTIKNTLDIKDEKYNFRLRESDLRLLNEHRNFRVNSKNYLFENEKIYSFNDNDLSYNFLDVKEDIKDYKIEGNKLILLTYNKISKIKEINLSNLKILKETIIDENEYDVIELNTNYFYLMNKSNIKKIYRFGKLKNIFDEFFAFSEAKEQNGYDYFEKTLKAKINKVYKIKVENEKIFKITGERINDYNMIEPFYAVLINTGVLNFSELENQKNSNEYYISSIGDSMFSLENRRKVNIYEKGKYSKSYTFNSDVYISGVVKDKEKIVFCGYYINSKGNNFFILTINSDNWQLNNIKEAIIPNNIFQNNYYYIITGTNNKYYYCEYEIIKK